MNFLLLIVRLLGLVIIIIKLFIARPTTGRNSQALQSIQIKFKNLSSIKINVNIISLEMTFKSVCIPLTVHRWKKKNYSINIQIQFNL